MSRLARRPARAAVLAAASLAAASLAAANSAATDDGEAAGRFRVANEAARGGDYPAAIAGYRELAASGAGSGSLYWNWAQAALARGAHGQALWALLQARELEPGDARLDQEIERLRAAASLDPAEIAPEPLHALARRGRRHHLGPLALALLAGSLGLHLLARRRRGWPLPASWALALGALLLALPPLAALLARPAAVVIRADAALFDAATPSAAALGRLREGEVVPVLGESGGYLRLEDSSGARGWARAEDVWLLGRPPAR